MFWKASWLSLVVAILVGCDSDGGGTAATAKASVSAAVPVVVPKGTVITLDGENVLVGKKKVATVRKADGSKYVEGLLNHLRKEHVDAEAFMGRKLVGLAVLRLKPDTPMSVTKALFHTTALVPYPTCSLEVHPGFVTVKTIVPLMPGYGGMVEPPLALHLHVKKGEVNVARMHGTKVLESVKTDVAGLKKVVVGQFNSHKMDEYGQPDVVLLADDQLVYSDLTAALREVDAARKEIGTEKLEVVLAGTQWGSRHVAPPDPSSKTRVREAKLVVKGNLHPKKIRPVLHGTYKKLKSCYDKELKKDDKIEGKVLLRFVISQNGGVKSVSVSDEKKPSELPGGLMTCVVKTTYPLVFREPDDGKIVTVSYEILFTNS